MKVYGKILMSLGFAGVLFFLGARTGQAAPDFDRQWPQWRGPEMSGVARHATPPLKWSEKTNVRWKKPIPGIGHGSPIVWGDRVYVLTAIETDKRAGKEPEADPAEKKGRGMPKKSATSVLQFDVLALQRKDGAVAWRRTVREQTPHEGTHGDGSWASGSPLTDGERLYAFFGSYGLYCLDMDGNPLWETDLGDMRTRMAFGEGTTPALFGNTIVVNWDHEGDSFIVALDKKTGSEIWRAPREERTSWATPVTAEVNGTRQVIVSATNRIRSYDLASGALIWECGGMTENVVPSPIVSDGLLYAMSGYRGNSLLCIDLSKAKGDITGSDAIAWSRKENTPYVPSPLLYDGALYFMRSSSEVLSCLNAKTGEEFYSAQPLEGLKGVYSSPVGAAGRVYITGRNGVTVALERGPEYEVLATNRLEDNFTASAALVDGEIFLRGHKALYCIAEK